MVVVTTLPQHIVFAFPRILVAVSDDDLSKPAIQMAIRLALDQDAELRVACVSEVVPPQASSEQDLAEIETALREEGNAILQRVTEQATARGATQAASVRLSIGTVKDSIAQALARVSKVPVLIVRDEEAHGEESTAPEA